ncbi:MAG: NADH:flavin oxidoreductase [Chloroflexi bacterium AL-W]|nr:NADH:flavin oxidoreductase [Chloroflexi bacterium AL-N1]NOK68003.1 NADH:flavin oxidoreductase [Chloroflexi bacterium AL-N10]NOK73343.1 NADH:flavin oxidoreductase [Chloroflexi bacterium AL-N5]NOK83257.1 NADH:flavin oxidoreductase [Chloroflexi bacterium AL-W]NOK87674.1 NADH:flavin oxidoreductase [Chloroflexi bacterium AL-N15]
MRTLPRYKLLASIKTADAFSDYIRLLGILWSFDEELDNGQRNTLGQPYKLNGRMIGNRFAVLPMEGWDSTPDGLPTELTQRRWQRSGASGAKLIWGGEATAVRHDGRGSPKQLMLLHRTATGLGRLRQLFVDSHANHHDHTEDLLVGLQLTHSGRFARPNNDHTLEPHILYTHPLLNQKFRLSEDYPLLSDSEIDELIGDFVKAAVYAHSIGFDFVDITHCHGYLGHEFLSAVERTGRYGGSFANRTRFLREIVNGIRRDAPGLQIGVRLSAFDMLPFQSGLDEIDGTQVPLADTPILFLSARADEADRLEGFRAGADDYLTKPFSPQELIYRLQALIRRSQGQSYTCVDVGALHIDPSRQEVTAGTQVVPLTPKEFNLLYLLARRPGMVFSRVELLQRVWGYTFVGNTRTVDVHVNRVRRKLAHFNGAGIQLATAWSVGYKLLPTHDAAA